MRRIGRQQKERRQPVTKCQDDRTAGAFLHGEFGVVRGHDPVTAVGLPHIGRVSQHLALHIENAHLHITPKRGGTRQVG